MGVRLVGILVFILCLNVSGMWMAESGFNDVAGVDYDVGMPEKIDQFDQTDDGLSSSSLSGVSDYLGFTVAALGYLVNALVLLGGIADSLRIVGFPGWFTFPLMNFLIRPIWMLGLVEVLRGVILE